MAASLYHVTSKEVENQIFIADVNIHVCINNPKTK